MPSPFPGLDPYVEASGRWGDFHLSTLVAIRAALNARLPENYAAQLDDNVWVGGAAPDQGPRPPMPDPFPDLPIPLTPDVAPVQLALRPCLDRVYEEGKYGELPYDKPLTPRPRKRDAAWIRATVAARPPAEST